MSVTFPPRSVKGAVASSKKPSRSSAKNLPTIVLDQPGRIRIKHFRVLLGNLSRSAFYARLALGRVPQPDGHDPSPYWKTTTVKEFLES